MSRRTAEAERLTPVDAATISTEGVAVTVAPVLDLRPPVAFADPTPRPQARGKFLFVGEEKLYVRGVTYGPFANDAGEGGGYGSPKIVDRDFAMIAANGINAVRTYTVPPRWLLDIAWRRGLRVMVGLAWEQHVTFLSDRRRTRDIEARVRAGARACAGHPALLCYAIGNEIPAPIVRWHGRRRVERFLRRLYLAVKREDPNALVTYANYPSTEYLQLPFVDLVCFNVYLESEDRLDAYLARLQNIAGDRPLLITELGLDAKRNGNDRQAQALGEQIRSVFRAGCAGAFVFSWTDEWSRGGEEVVGWQFGLTSRRRRPKPALEHVKRAFTDVPFGRDVAWPRISVVVCTLNGARTIRECCEALRALDYPDFEVIFVNDGSTDETADIARRCGFPVISTENQGLSSARNTGAVAASGEIVAYLDDDAYPDAHWLRYLALAFLEYPFAGVGGPNLPPAEDGFVAAGVAHAPGGPVHVLLSDREAEHIPGCNMAFRKAALEEVGGFDPRFRVAGDDVDVCWRLLDQGSTLGFSPAALVWHHRRGTVSAYWRQQRGYGKAEALLEEKWPERYNAVGHVSWAGSVYGPTRPRSGRRARIYQGEWGTAPFQWMEDRGSSRLGSIPAMPEWYLVVAGLAMLATCGTLWSPLLVALLPLGLALAFTLATAGARALGPYLETGSPRERLRMRALIALLHLLQPMARLWGRLRHGLSPWRDRGSDSLRSPWMRNEDVWSGRFRPSTDWLRSIESGLNANGMIVLRGGPHDRWDLEGRGGSLAGVRVRMAIEEHEGGAQLVRFRSWPRWSRGAALACGSLAALQTLAALDDAWPAAMILSSVSLQLVLRMAHQAAAAAGALRIAMRELR